MKWYFENLEPDFDIEIVRFHNDKIDMQLYNSNVIKLVDRIVHNPKNVDYYELITARKEKVYHIYSYYGSYKDYIYYLVYNFERNLNRMSNKEIKTHCRFIINSLSALYGYEFSSANWRYFFAQTDWYIPKTKSPNFSKFYKDLVEYIKEIEESHN